MNSRQIQSVSSSPQLKADRFDRAASAFPRISEYGVVVTAQRALVFAVRESRHGHLRSGLGLHAGSVFSNHLPAVTRPQVRSAIARSLGRRSTDSPTSAGRATGCGHACLVTARRSCAPARTPGRCGSGGASPAGIRPRHWLLGLLASGPGKLPTTPTQSGASPWEETLASDQQRDS